MSRVTAPVSKLARALGSTSTVHNAGAVLMPKYAELLRNREQQHQESRRLTTAHRPTPQPSLANRSKPLMQTFSSSALSHASVSHHLDAAILPALGQEAFDAETPRVPLLPDLYRTARAAADVPVFVPSAVVAADPDNVLPATPLSEVRGLGLDIDLNFFSREAVDDFGAQAIPRMP